MLRLKHERLRRGLTQDTVGVAARISQPTVALIEKGRLIPTAAQLDRLAAIFHISHDALLKPVEIVEDRA